MEKPICDEQSIEARTIESIIAPALDKLASTNRASSELLRANSHDRFFSTYQTQGAITELAVKLLSTLREA